MGPTGNVITGDVLDVNKAALERALQTYDDQLYIIWNPRKQYGYGIWELRRRPNKKTIKETVEFKGQKYHIIDYKENDFEHHVFDMPILDYSILGKLKRSDMWAKSEYDGHNHDKITRLVDKIEDRRVGFQQEIKQKALDNALYELKQDRAYLNQFREDILAGLNPAELARYWDKV